MSKHKQKEVKLYCKKKDKPAAMKGIKWRKCICLKLCKEKLQEIVNNSSDPSLN